MGDGDGFAVDVGEGLGLGEGVRVATPFWIFRDSDVLPRVTDPGFSLWLVTSMVWEPLEKMVLSRTTVPGANDLI